jgi:fructokinase
LVNPKPLFAGIEAGGTKFVCAIGDGDGKIFDRCTIATTTPAETLPKIIEFFSAANTAGTLCAMGIGSFGPIDTHPQSATYGYITSTPKTAWINCDLVGAMKNAFNIPIGFETDVATAALGEYTWGAGQNLPHIIYMTVGTGIGAASIINGELMTGMGHQEMGHIFIPHDQQRDPFAGICPYHHDCLEGLACGGAIKARWQVPSALDLPADHPAWDLEADYLATALMTYILTLSPHRIIMGGGVMKQMHLFPMIRTKVLEKLNGYISEPLLLTSTDDYIVPPGLSERAGVTGAIALAKKIFEK